MSIKLSYLWGIYFNLLPFYFFSSGLPQMADYFMIFLGSILFISHFKRKQSIDKTTLKVFYNLLLFSSYAFFITCIWALLESNLSILLYPLYYFYDVLIFILIYIEFKRSGRNFLIIAFYSLGVSSIFVFLFSFTSIVSTTSIRNIAFFNNPNQLGYYALSTACILVLLSDLISIKKSLKLIFLFCLYWLALLSLSKAAIVAITTLYIIYFLKKAYLIIGFGVLVLAIISSVNLLQPKHYEKGNLFNNVKKRILSIGKGEDDNFDQRGYYRVIQYPEYLLFGAAEGAARSRSYFNGKISDFGGEFHSTWGTLIFCYGMIGSLLFLMFLFQIFAGNKLIFLAYFFPMILYGFTHQGLRFTQFWIFLSFLFVGKGYKYASSKYKSVSSSAI